MQGPSDADICIRAVAEGPTNEDGDQHFVVSDTEGGGRGAEVADAVRYMNGADHQWTTQDRKELRQQEETDDRHLKSVPEFGAVHAWTSWDGDFVQ